MSKFHPADKFAYRKGDPRFAEHEDAFIITDREYPIGTATSETYARILAAAPEMLNSLKWAETMIRTFLSIKDQKLSHGLKELRSVIMKAEGK